jgi:hypothetical protein
MQAFTKSITNALTTTRRDYQGFVGELVYPSSANQPSDSYRLKEMAQ